MEESVKKEIIEWLRKQPFVDFVHDNDKMRVRARMWTRTKALPDLTGNLVGGRAMYIEIKDPKNKTRRFDQLEFLEKRRRSGAFACLVDSIEQMKIYFRAEGFVIFKENKE